MRVGIDSNILLRALLDDDVQQSAMSRDVIASFGPTNVGYIGVTVILELFWVLKSRYKLGRELLCDTISSLLTTEGLEIESFESVSRSVTRFAKGGVDFADILLAERNSEAGCIHTVTLDQNAAAKIPGMELLS